MKESDFPEGFEAGLGDVGMSLPPTAEDQAKSVNAFVKDEFIKIFGKEFYPLFSKHIILSFVNKDEVGLLIQMFDNAFLSKIINEDITEDELFKYNIMRMIFFTTIKRAVGRQDNERTLLAKSITENILASNRKETGLEARLFGKRR